MERETGIEPATSSLGSWHSTAELLPLGCLASRKVAPPRKQGRTLILLTAVNVTCFAALFNSYLRARRGTLSGQQLEAEQARVLQREAPVVLLFGAIAQRVVDQKNV